MNDKPQLLDWIPPSGGNTISALLYHIALVEASWLYEEVLMAPPPPEIEALLPYPSRDDHKRLYPVTGMTLDEHVARLATIRAALLKTYQAMDLEDYRRLRVLPNYEATPEWVLAHLIEHEHEHRGQIVRLIADAG